MLSVTEYDADDTARVRREYAGSAGSRNWTIATVDLLGGETTLRVESIGWQVGWDPNLAGSDPPPPRIEHRTYTVFEGSTEVYREIDTYAFSMWGNGEACVPLERCVDPNGSNLVTTWEYDVQGDPNVNGQVGIALRLVKHDDGSWVRYSRIENDPNLALVEESGWKDEDPNGATRRRLTMSYDLGDPFHLKSVEESVFDGSSEHLVRKSEYGYDPNANTIYIPNYVYLDAAGQSTLVTSLCYPVGSDERHPSSIDYPDLRRDEYVYDNEISFTASLNATVAPPTYQLAPGGSATLGYRYRAVTHLFCSESDPNGGLVGGRSTKEVVILDGGGLPMLEETSVWTESAWERIGWTARTYDVQSRLTGVYHHDGTYETTTYPDCCSKTVTDSTGVETAYVSDRLGRIESVTRVGVGAQSDITTTHVYAAAQETVTVAGGEVGSQLSQTTIRKYDGARRLISVETANTTGDLKTIYEYGTTSAGGRRVAVYDGYSTSATQGTPGVRDRVTEYYLDGRVKSVTGAAVVGTYYDYGYGSDPNGATWTTVATGSSLSSPRYQTTYYDMARRVSRVERPGWQDPNSAGTLTAHYHYDDGGDHPTGRLLRVENPAQADTLYGYVDPDGIARSALDVDSDGQLDLSGSDRVTESKTEIGTDPNAGWWRITRTWVYGTNGSSDATLTSATYTRVAGFDEGVIREERTIDAAGNETSSTTTLNRSTALLTQTTYYPGAAQPAVEYTQGGRLMQSVSQTGVTTTYAYDDLGRRTEVTDGRGNTTTTHYDAGGRVDWVEDAAGNHTSYAYYEAGSDAPGRLWYISEPDTGSGDPNDPNDNPRTYYAYDPDPNHPGLPLYRVWGGVPQPTETVYDGYGQRTALKTFRGGSGWDGPSWPGSPGTADVTHWNYHEATGLLNSKTDAASQAVIYAYTADGKLATRTWARGVVTTYAYDEDTAELLHIGYSDDTQGVTYTYDRLGRVETVRDPAGFRTLAYDPNTLVLTTETYGDPEINPYVELFLGVVVTRLYEGSGDAYPGRFNGFSVGTSNDPNLYYAARYGYDPNSGRLSRATGPGLPTGTGTSHGAFYGYLADSDLAETTSFKNTGGTTLAGTTRQFEAQRDLVAGVRNTWQGDPNQVISLYDYRRTANPNTAGDALGRRTDVTYSGVAFDPNAAGAQTFGYNSRNELTASTRSAPDLEWTYGYAYDPIGNRTTSTASTPDENVSKTYARNALNQYARTQRTNWPEAAQIFDYDADGNLHQMYITGDMNCDGQTTYADTDCFIAALGHCPDPNTGGNPPGYACGSCDCLHGDFNGNGSVTFADIDGYAESLGQVAGAVYTWDGENRLVSAGPPGAPNGSQKAEYMYDYLGRRVQKKVWTRQGSPPAWVLTEQRRYVWAGWLLLLELDGAGGMGVPPVRKYTWGLDLAGQMGGVGVAPANLEGAGGIGGLLAVHDRGADPNTVADDLDYVYLYDANGNVGQVIDLNAADPNAALKAKYEYGPYGGRINFDPNVAEYNQPWRFSTKQFDAETGLGYWGYRYYSPGMGRWISRDPLGEPGGRNLYGYACGDPIDMWDLLGLWGDGKAYYQKQIDAFEAMLDGPGVYLGGSESAGFIARVKAEIATLQYLMSKEPLGHSDFVDWPEFDWTLEDHDPATDPVKNADKPSVYMRHYQSLREVQPKMDAAIASCDHAAVERYGHQGQDTFSHWDAGVTPPEHVLRRNPHEPDDSRLHPAAYAAAAAWTQAQMDKWSDTCVKQPSGTWVRRPWQDILQRKRKREQEGPPPRPPIMQPWGGRSYRSLVPPPASPLRPSNSSPACPKWGGA